VKKLILPLLIAFWPATSVMGVAPCSYTESIGFSFRLNGTGSGTMTFYEESPTAPSLALTVSGAPTESNAGFGWMRPGKQYRVNIQGSGASEYWLNFVAPQGYDLFVDNTQRDLVYRNTGGGGFNYDYTIELRPAASSADPAPFSSFSGIQIGKSVSWEIGLGTIAGGRSAGRITFKEYDLSNSSSSRARLYLGQVPNYGEVWTFYDGPSNQTLRQVSVPQGLIDLLDDGSGGYNLRFFMYSQLEGSPGNPFILHGDPWKTIHVQLTASNQLTITETQGAVTRRSQLTLTSGSVGSGTYVWTLQEGDASTWIRTTTHTSTGTLTGIVASGGTITNSGGYTVHKFTSSGTFTVTSVQTGQNLEALVVAGGGGGGGTGVNGGGGGGGGGVVNHGSLATVTGSYSVVVGAGGTGGASGSVGGDSSFSGITAKGGGGGGTYRSLGANGGSGGGSGRDMGSTSTSVSTQDNSGGGTGHGSAGGASPYASYGDAGGGGGAGGAGASGQQTFPPVTSGPGGGNGGAGFTSSITGAANTYGGGGGGCSEYHNGGAGGAGSGGKGNGADGGPASGTANTGGGGGGGQSGGPGWNAAGQPGGSGVVVVRYQTPVVNDRTDVVEVRTGGATGTVVSKTRYVYTQKAWGEELVSTVADPDSSALTTTYTYYEDSSSLGNYRRVRSVTAPTSSWTAYEYYNDWDRRGELKYRFEPYLDAPATVSTSPTTGRVTYFEYAADWSGRYTRPTLQQENINNVLTGQTTYTNGDITGSGWPREFVYAYAHSDAANYRTDYTERYRADCGPDLSLRVTASKIADQSQTSWSMATGDYHPSTGVFDNIGSSTNYVRYIYAHGSTNGSGAEAVSSWGVQTIPAIYLVPDKSTVETVIYPHAFTNWNGQVVRTETWVYAGSGSFALLTWENLDYDGHGNVISRTAGNGTSTAARETTSFGYTDGRLMSTVAPDGTETHFTYDEIGRTHASTKMSAPSINAVLTSGYSYPAQGDIVTTYTYDGASNVTDEVVSGGGLSLTTHRAFDAAGRCTSITVPGSYTTSYAFSAGGKIVTATLPGGATKITEAYLDGQLKSVTGSGVVQENYSYSIDAGTGARVCQSVFGGISSAWTNTFLDWLGRKIQESRPEWGGSTSARNWAYGSNGLLSKFTQPGVAATLYSYDTMGVLLQECLDVNGNNTIEAYSSDRIKEHIWQISSNDGGNSWWRRQYYIDYPIAGSGAYKQTSRLDECLAGSSTGIVQEKYSFDQFGNATHSTTVLDRANKKVTTTVTAPDSTISSVSVAYNGLPCEAEDTTGVIMRYEYDALGRKIRDIDPRTGTTTTAFCSGSSFVYSLTDPANVAQATYTYDSAGRVATVTDGVAKITRYDYDTLNHVVHQYGNAVYPVSYVYDSLGRKTSQSTYRADAGWNNATWPSNPGTADTTTWNFHQATGLLQSKLDASIHGANFTYDVARRVHTRTWARGSVATYGYDSNTGELTSVTYSNDPASTPSVSYTYNRLGQVATSNNSAGYSSTMTYNLGGTLELQNEDFADYFGTGRRVNYTYASSGVVGRPTGFGVGTSGNPTADQNVTYGYDTNGRFNTLTGGSGSATQTFTYGYTANSHLIGTITDSAVNYTDSRTYDPHHNWVATRATTNSGGNVATFTYTRDNIGRVDHVSKTGTIYSPYADGSGLTTTYGYDDRSEVNSEVTRANSDSSVLPPRNDSYAYDCIGNRNSVTHNGNSATYNPNALNQYTSRGVTGFDLTGAATAGTSLWVDGVLATRKGGYFAQSFILNSSSTQFTGSVLGIQPQVKSVNGVVSFNYSGQPIGTPTVTGPAGQSAQALEFQGTPYHVGIEYSLLGYTFQNGRTYTFGYWARTLSGSRTVTLMLTDNINDGITSATWTIDTNWKWVAVTKAYTSLGASPRCFYTWDGGAQPFQAYGTQIADITDSSYAATQPTFVAATPESFTYDLDGNLTDDGRWHYTYDAENRLISMESNSASVGAGVSRQLLTFAYDNQGRRISKKAQSGWNGSTYTSTDLWRRFIYQGWNLAAEINHLSGDTVIRNYFWGLDLSGSIQGAGGVGGLLLLQDGGGGATYMPIYDALGNIHGLLMTNGVLAAVYEYDAFGQTIREAGAWAPGNPFRFSTKYTDIETGLANYGLRYYSPSLGRFVNRDPSEEIGGVHLYRFANNNAVNYWDRLGMVPGIGCGGENFHASGLITGIGIHGAGVVVTVANEVGVGRKGSAGAQGSIGFMGFTSGPRGAPSNGVFSSGGAFVQQPGFELKTPNVASNPWALGINWTAFSTGLAFTNATSIEQLRDIFSQFNINLPLISFTIAKDGNGTNLVTINIGFSQGGAFSKYSTNTAAATVWSWAPGVDANDDWDDFPIWDPDDAGDGASGDSSGGDSTSTCINDSGGIGSDDFPNCDSMDHRNFDYVPNPGISAPPDDQPTGPGPTSRFLGVNDITQRLQP